MMMATGDKDLTREAERANQETWNRSHPIPHVEYKAVTVASVAGYINAPDLDQREMRASGWTIDHMASEPTGLTTIVWCRFPPLLDPPEE